jgi:hypothetical protein
MKIAVDFDGTVVSHRYPRIGSEIGSVSVLRDLVKAGHSIILNTMRSGKELDEAIAWFKKNDIPLYGVNEDPGQKEWTDSPKVYAHLYIDDCALGVPLKTSALGSRFVDWGAVRRLLEDLNLLGHFSVSDFVRGPNGA